MTKTAAIELAPRGIRVHSIHPDFIETGMSYATGSEFVVDGGLTADSPSPGGDSWD